MYLWLFESVGSVGRKKGVFFGFLGGVVGLFWILMMFKLIMFFYWVLGIRVRVMRFGIDGWLIVGFLLLIFIVLGIMGFIVFGMLIFLFVLFFLLGFIVGIDIIFRFLWFCFVIGVFIFEYINLFVYR